MLAVEHGEPDALLDFAADADLTSVKVVDDDDESVAELLTVDVIESVGVIEEQAEAVRDTVLDVDVENEDECEPVRDVSTDGET